MKQSSSALLKAISSGDTDLVYHVLLRLRSTLSPGDFFHLLDDSVTPALTPAVRLLQVYGREGDRRLLRDFYYQDDRRTENACLDMEEAGEMSTAEERTERLREAAKHFGEDKGRAFEAKVSVLRDTCRTGLTFEDGRRCCSASGSADSIRARTRQQVPLPRFECQRFCLPSDSRGSEQAGRACARRLENSRQAVRALRSGRPRLMCDSWWWIKLKALAHHGDWDGLEAFAKSKKSPIGYEPFVVRPWPTSLMPIYADDGADPLA